MKKQYWIILVIVLAALLLGGFAWMRLSSKSSEPASSPNGETEIIPEDPNAPWPDLSPDVSSDEPTSPDSTGSGSSGLGTAPGTPAPGNTSLPGSTAGSDASSASSGSETITGDTSSSGGSTSAGGPVSGGSSSSSGSSDVPDNTPGGGIPSEPDSGTSDDVPVISEAELHEYELPYIPLS